MPSRIDRLADAFITDAVQAWGQTPEARIAAVQAIVTEARWNAQIVGGGPSGPILCALPLRLDATGPDAVAVTGWLGDLMLSMPWGRYQDEARHVAAAIEARQ